MTDSTASSPALQSSAFSVLSRPVVWVALIALATLWFHLSGPLGPDVAWLTTVSERILSGQVLYVDILEPNPPVAGYLYMIPVMVGRLLKVPSDPLVVIFTIATGLILSGTAARIVTRAGLVSTGLLWPVSFLLVGAAWGEDFAQREHFATMAALPLIAVAALRAAGIKPRTWQWVLAGVCGGFILAVKPHFALVIAAPALYVAIRRRSVRSVFTSPEHWIAAAIFGAFLLLIVVAFPAFITDTMPVATTVYVPDRRDLLLLLSLFIVQCCLALMFAALAGFWRRIMRDAWLGVTFFTGVGFFLAFFAQSRGYAYQVMPSIALFAIVIVVAFVESASGKGRTIATVMALACAGVVAAVPVVNDIHQWRMRDPIYAALAPYGPGLRVANISPDLTAGSPLHRVLGDELVNSPPGLLMSMSAYRLREERHPTGAWAAAIDAVEASEKLRLRQDLLARPPDLIVTPATGFDWMEWAREDETLRTILAGYEDITVLPYDGYALRLMRRKGLQPLR